jgi:hypothetical protein
VNEARCQAAVRCGEHGETPTWLVLAGSVVVEEAAEALNMDVQVASGC